MKRALVATILIILTMGALRALNPRLSAMGRIGIAVSGTDMQSYDNPAAVYFDDNRTTFTFHADMEDTMGREVWPYLPSSDIDVQFVADMITMDLEVSYYSNNFRTDTKHVDLYQQATLNVNFSAGYKYISGGIGVTGGSTQQRLDVAIDKIWDFPVQTFLSPFDRVVNSEFIQVSAGLMADFGNLSFGMLMANILGKDGATTIFNWDTLFSQTGVGVYWSRSQYSSRGKLNNFIYSVGVDFDYLFSEDRRMNAGAEIQFRLIRDSSVFFRGGYTAKLSEMDNGTITVGVGANIRMFELALNADFPMDGYPRSKIVFTLLF